MLKYATMFVAIAVLAVALASAALAEAVPPVLQPGETTYHYAFVTSTSTDATSTDIATYNAHVQAAADSGSLTAPLDLTWAAIASTSTVDANVNAPVSGPVFLLDGTRIADDATHLWGTGTAGYGDPANLYAGILIDENGVDNYGGSEYGVWTGTQPDGTKGDGTDFGDGDWGYHLGSDAGGNSIWGDANGWEHRYNMHWVAEWQNGAGAQYPLYAISEPIGGGAIPEPGTLVMLMTGLIGLAAAGRRRR